MEKKFIKVINLKRRPDRKNNMIEKLQNVSINENDYEIIEAVDGKELQPTLYLKNFFNIEGYRKGVIGCALSHIHLWERLVNDDKNDYYVILEDDVIFVDNFKEKLERSIELFLQNKIEYTLIGAFQIENQNLNKDNIQLVNNNNYAWSTTCGYIISKSGSKKLLESIKNNGIKAPIDHSCIYTRCFDVYFLNEYIVHTFVYGATSDTDIQNVYDCLDFSNIDENENIIEIDNICKEELNDKIITISFTDWWLEEYNGGNFDRENNYFTKLFTDYTDYKIKVIEPHENPDILFYSIFGYQHQSLSAKRKIFFSGESQSKREDANYNITFDENCENNCRLPLWIIYLNDALIENCNIKNGIFEKANKNKFCSIICQRDNENNKRSEIVNKLSTYKKVDCGGPFLNNIGYIVPRGTNCSGKIYHHSNYKFVLTFENRMYPGYVTEKILDEYKSNSIPIYWGTPDVVKDFNPETFINANDFNSIDELVNHIIKVDNDDELYNSYFNKPIFSDYWLSIFQDPNKTFYKKLINNIIG